MRDHEPKKEDIIRLEEVKEEEDSSHFESEYYNYGQGEGDVGPPYKKQHDIADTGDHGIGGEEKEIDDSNIESK